MLPEMDIELTELTVEEQPSTTYRLDLDAGRIDGYIDDEDAVLQMVQKLLGTEKYTFAIYGSEYGVELQSLIGQPLDYIASELERTISESLLMDDRILSVSNFHLQSTNIDAVSVSFTINSIYGLTDFSMEVQTA